MNIRTFYNRKKIIVLFSWFMARAAWKQCLWHYSDPHKISIMPSDCHFALMRVMGAVLVSRREFHCQTCKPGLLLRDEQCVTRCNLLLRIPGPIMLLDLHMFLCWDQSFSLLRQEYPPILTSGEMLSNPGGWDKPIPEVIHLWRHRTSTQNNLEKVASSVRFRHILHIFGQEWEK